MRIFLSHAKPDKPFVRQLAAHLQILNHQEFLMESGIEVDFAIGYGVIVGCPECGAGLGRIKRWIQQDLSRDDTYAGAECESCGWQGGGEI